MFGFLKPKADRDGSRHIGRKFYSLAHGSMIIVSAYHSDKRWWFRYPGEDKATRHPAKTSFQQFTESSYEQIGPKGCDSSWRNP